MKLSAPFIQLPLLFDAEHLAAEIAAIEESAWMPHPQGFAGNSMLPVVAVDGEAANESFAGPMQPTPHLQRCPYLQRVIASFGVTVGRTRLMRLSGQAEVKRHVDKGYYWADRVRVHVPIVTQPTVRFECGGETINMASGECWIFDTWRQHRVDNDAERARIHLVCDTVGGERFWEMVGNGRNHLGQALGPAWIPEQVQPGSPPAPLLFERTNVPTVMTPWEITRRIDFLLGEAQPGPVLGPLQDLAGRLCRQWTSLWAAYGESEDGWPHYREALDCFIPQMQQVAGALALRNELRFTSALLTLVSKFAVGGLQGGASARAVSMAAAGGQAGGKAKDPQFHRPIFIVSSPRSGSTLVFETLACAANVCTIGGESHEVIEGVNELSPVYNGLGSNRLTGQQATASVAATLRERFRRPLRDRDGKAPTQEPLRMLEKTPKNSLRVPFLASVFPEAEFVFLHRDVRETLGSMIDAWNSQRFRTYPGLPGWTGLSWSLLLVPGWQNLIDKPLAEVVARQWQSAMEFLLDDLQRMPRERVHFLNYNDFVKAPDVEAQRLCQALDLCWDRPVDGTLQLSRYTLSQPNPDKWRRHVAEIEAQMQRLKPTIERIERLVSGAAGNDIGDDG